MCEGHEDLLGNVPPAGISLTELLNDLPSLAKVQEVVNDLDEVVSDADKFAVLDPSLQAPLTAALELLNTVKAALAKV
jgi:hypothetical protein